MSGLTKESLLKSWKMQDVKLLSEQLLAERDERLMKKRVKIFLEHGEIMYSRYNRLKLLTVEIRVLQRIIDAFYEEWVHNKKPVKLSFQRLMELSETRSKAFQVNIFKLTGIFFRVNTSFHANGIWRVVHPTDAMYYMLEELERKRGKGMEIQDTEQADVIPEPAGGEGEGA